METRRRIDTFRLLWQEELQQQFSEMSALSDEEVYEQIREFVLQKGMEVCLPLSGKRKLIKDIFNSIRRFDVLQELLEDEEITEIMINGAKDIFVEKHGKISRFSGQFLSEQKLLDVVQQIAAGVNRRVNEASPIMDARLSDGSRVNVVLEPVALQGTAVTIRKFARQSFSMEQLQKTGSISKEGAAFLQAAVVVGCNIFISGGTGSGKTTFLNALADYIPAGERVITIEDSAELSLMHENLVSLEARMANVEGKNEIRIRDLIKTALRMRPDRIIVGEVRDDAAVDMLQAMNTGHDGSLSTGHANSTKDMLYRLETLVLMGLDIPLAAVRQQIVSALDVIVHLGRLSDGSRKVLEISEVVGLQGEAYQVNPLFFFSEEGIDEAGKIKGTFQRTKNEVWHKEKFRRAGVETA